MAKCKCGGFTLLELAIVVGIIAILAATALIGYQYYTEKAASTELIEQYDELRERAALAVSEGTNLCDDLEKALSPNSVLYNPHAELSIVKADPDIIGLQIKADVAGEGAHNTAIARAAHDTLNRNNQVIAGAVVTESVVSFTALLTNSACSGNKASTPQSSTPVVATQSGSQATAGSPVVSSRASGSGSSPVSTAPTVAATSSSGCPAGQVLNGQTQQCITPACPHGQEEVAGQCVPWCGSDEARNASGVCEALPDPNKLIQALSPEKQAALAALPKDPTSDPTIVATPADVPPPPVAWEMVTGAEAQRFTGPTQCPPPPPPGPDSETGNVYDGPTSSSSCELDFGRGMCNECFVQEMCATYCGLFKPDAEQAAAMRAGRIYAVRERCEDDRRWHRDNGWCQYLDDLVAGRKQ
jgi:prepilin-type N-terminal cleavage/methylation domain-containing protein